MALIADTYAAPAPSTNSRANVPSADRYSGFSGVRAFWACNNVYRVDRSDGSRSFTRPFAMASSPFFPFVSDVNILRTAGGIIAVPSTLR